MEAPFTWMGWGHYILLYVFSGFHPLSGYIGKPYDEGLLINQLTLWGIYGCAGWVLVCVCVKCVYITGSGCGGWRYGYFCHPCGTWRVMVGGYFFVWGGTF